MRLFHFAFLLMLRRGRKHLTLLLLYAFVVAFFASTLLLAAGLRAETQHILKSIPDLWVQQLAGGRLVPLPIALQDSFKAMRGVARVIPRAWGYVFDAASGAVYTVAASDSSFADVHAIQKLGKTKLDKGEILVGTGILLMRNLQIGDFLSISENNTAIVSYKIVGIFDASTDLLTKDLILMFPDDARYLLDLDKQEITDIALQINNPEEVENIGRKIDEKYENLRVVSKRQLQTTYDNLFGWRGGLVLYGSVLALFAFLILVYQRASGFDDDERREIGIMKSTGWYVHQVLWLKTIESAIIAVTATFLGLILAYFHVFWLDAPLLKPLLAGWSVLYPSFSITPTASPDVFFAVFCLSVVPYLTVSIFPAWKIAVTDPAEVLK